MHNCAKPGKIIAETGCKQVGAVVSSQRGQLVTICCAIIATGNTVPPMFVFPRVHFRTTFCRAHLQAPLVLHTHLDG